MSPASLTRNLSPYQTPVSPSPWRPSNTRMSPSAAIVKPSSRLNGQLPHTTLGNTNNVCRTGQCLPRANSNARLEGKEKSRRAVFCSENTECLSCTSCMIKVKGAISPEAQSAEALSTLTRTQDSMTKEYQVLFKAI